MWIGITDNVLLFTACLIDPNLTWTTHNPIIFRLIIFWHVESFSTDFTVCMVISKTTVLYHLIIFLFSFLDFSVVYLPTTFPSCTGLLAVESDVFLHWFFHLFVFFSSHSIVCSEIVPWDFVLVALMLDSTFSFFPWLFFLSSRPQTRSKCSVLVSLLF